MNKKKIILITLIGLIVTAYVGCKIAYPSVEFNYKVTVEIETPEGIKSGSTVQRAHLSQGIKLGEYGGGNGSTIGEAVVVDLGSRGVLFALAGFDFYTVIFRVFPGPPGLTKKGMKYYSNLKNAKASLLKASRLPRFVTFKNMDDPMSVRMVDIHQLDKSFGAGVRIKDVTIEMTDEPVTWRIDKYLPWLQELNGGYLGGGSSSYGAPLGLHAGYFQRR